MKATAITLLFITITTQNNVYATDDDDEDFLPQSTPAPAAVVAAVTASAATMAMETFDRCDNDKDMSAWERGGGEAGRTSQLNYCANEYDDNNGGSSGDSDGCLMDSDCIENCFQDTYGYTAPCSACFGAMMGCTVAEDCLDACSTNDKSIECQECNAPCIEQMNECTGLPLVSYCFDGSILDGSNNNNNNDDDPSCTYALRLETCEGKMMSEGECNDLGCCMWNPVDGSCSAACLVPEDGDACCAITTSSASPIASPAGGEPTGGNVLQTMSPTVSEMLPNSATASPNYVETAVPNPGRTAAPNYVETAAPTLNTASSLNTNQTIASPSSPNKSSSNNTDTMDMQNQSPTNSTATPDVQNPSPTEEPTMQPSESVTTPEPTLGPTNPPTSVPTAAVVTPPAPDKSRTINAAWNKANNNMAVLIGMGLTMVVGLA